MLDAAKIDELAKLTPEELVKALGPDLDTYVRMLKKIEAAARARDSLLTFMRYIMPDPNDVEDSDKSRYEVHRLHEVLGEALEKVQKGEILRLAISMPPQMGKSAICTRGFPAWYMGKTPWRNVIVGTYNQTFAGDFGEDVRAIMIGQRYQDVFKTRLRTGSKSKEQLVTEEGGKISFIGRDGSGTGKSADLFIIDDPYKNKADADSLATRDEVWGFFTRVMNTRMLNTGAVIIIHTRWHEDDLIGRLTDPTNPHYNADVAKHWTYINIPEIMDDEKIASILGKKVGDALWPERRSLEMLKVARLMDPVGFSALHMGKPTPPEGAFYQIEHLKGYEHKQLPKNMRYYLSGDLAVSTKYGADKTAIGIWGVDESAEPSLWLMPTLYWKKAGADEWVEWMLDQCGSYGILTAYMEKGQIDTAIGPFLDRRMMERTRAGKGNFVHIEKFPVVGDKGKRSQSFRTLCAMGRVRFPTFAPWWPAAKEQMLKFTGTGNDKEDDFCDMCGIMGQASAQLISAGVKKENNVIEPKVGTLAWTRWAADREKSRVAPGRIKRAW